MSRASQPYTTASSQSDQEKAHEPIHENGTTGHLEHDADAAPPDTDDPTRLHLRSWMYGLSSLLIVFFGATRQNWSMALAISALGLALLIAPPRARLRPVPTLCLFVIATIPTVAFLPASWFGGLEPWRVQLQEEWGIATGTLLTPDWRVTMEAWLTIFFFAFWLYSSLAQNMSDRGRGHLLRTLAWGSLIIGTLSILDFWGLVKVPWWPRWGTVSPEVKQVSGFGPFANHNHSASYFAWSCVLSASAALESYKRASRAWIFFFLGCLILIGCLLLNSSRAGLLLFFTSMSLWIGTAAMGRGKLRKFIVSCAIIGLVLSFALVSGSRVGERLRSMEISNIATSDLRFWLAEQTLKASSSAIWAGRGLGTFDYVFPHLNDQPQPDIRTDHPESDLLLILFDGGLLYTIPVVVLAFSLLSSTGPWLSARRKKRSHDSRSARRVRRSFGIASGIAIIHSIVDIPLHNPAYFMLFAVILGQAIRPRYLTTEKSLFSKFLFRSVGLAALVWSCGWWLLAFELPLGSFASSESAAFSEGMKASRSAQANQQADAMQHIHEAVRLAPLDFRWYMMRAKQHLILGHPHSYALQDFGRMRALEPHYAGMCFEEGNFWLSYAPEYAVIAFEAGIRRYPPPFANAIPLYQETVLRSSAYPEIHDAIWKMANRPSLQLVFLSKNHVTGKLWEQCLQDFLAKNPGLDTLNSAQKKYFFHIWNQKGTKEDILAYLQQNPNLLDFGWHIVATHYAKNAKFDEAWKIASKYIPEPARATTLTAADIPRLQKAQVINPLDALIAVELYYAQRAGEDLHGAKKTLEKLLQLPQRPTFIEREMAATLADLGDMRGAWELMDQIYANTPQDFSVLDEKQEDPDPFQRPAPPPPKVQGYQSPY